MKILLSSHAFYPSVGGIETVSEILAEQWTLQGHDVRVLTQTPDDQTRDFPYPILRRPSLQSLCAAVRWCDVYLQNNISLQFAWPLLFIHKPWVIAHHVWIRRPDGGRSWQDSLKYFLLRFARNITISRAISAALPVPSTVVGDPYRDDLFYAEPGEVRDRELIFVGRLVSDKGVDLLLRALQQLHDQDCRCRLTIVGDGPEKSRLLQMAEDLPRAGSVFFVGRKSGDELRKLLAQHRILVVPSLWEEPFGIVALEGIACGCLVVGSEKGGLKEAIGNCGLTVPNGELSPLVEAIKLLLTSPDQADSCRAQAPSHLARYHRTAVTDRYLAILREVTHARHSG